MTHPSRAIAVIAALLLALLALPGAAQAQAFTLAPSQPAVAAGQTISFVGTGFTPDERVASWITAPDQAVLGGDDDIASGADGRVTFDFKVPVDAGGGRWSFTAYGLVSKTPVIATFEVQGRDPATAATQAAVLPRSGSPGTPFAFVAFGFRSKEQVSYWLTGPDGEIHHAYPSGARTNADGRVDITWIAPRDALRGPWVITIQGLKSDVARGIPFEIQ